MASQNGMLIILIRNFRSAVALNPGLYFAIKVGLNCIRFSQVSGELVFPIEKHEKDAFIELFVFQRRPRLQNMSMGRRRDLIDRCEERYYQRPAFRSSEVCIEWRSIELKLSQAKVSFLIDIEFYPKVPVVPTKDSYPKLNDAQEEVEHESIQAVQKADQPIPNDLNTTTKESGKLRKLDKIRSAITTFRKQRPLQTPGKQQGKQEREHLMQADDNTVFYDLNSMPHNASPCDKYQHGDLIKLAASHKIDKPKDFNELIRDESSGYDSLPIDVSPRTFFNDAGNRLVHSERLNFMHPISSENVKLTSYLGGGKWDQPSLSRAALNWYLQPAVKSLPGPVLQPKCPKGMLWEEYYLTSRELYIKDVLK